MSKRSYAICHTKYRARQRYGIRIAAEDNAAIVKAIQGRRAKFITKVSNRVTAFDVEWQGTVIRVLYDKNAKVILTVLGMDMKI